MLLVSSPYLSLHHHALVALLKHHITAAISQGHQLQVPIGERESVKGKEMKGRGSERDRRGLRFTRRDLERRDRRVFLVVERDEMLRKEL